MAHRAEGFPRNLIKDTFTDRGFTDISADLNADQRDALENILDDVAEGRCKMAVDLYYRQMLPYQKCAEIIGVTTESVRQMIHKVQRKVRNPSRAKYILYGTNGYKEMWRREEEEYYRTHKKVKVFVSPMEGCVDEIGLSTRAYNCLWRSGIKTVGEVVNLSHEGLSKIKNAGVKTVSEIEKAVEEYLRNTEGHWEEKWVEVENVE